MWKLNIENIVNAPITTKRIYSTYDEIWFSLKSKRVELLLKIYSKIHGTMFVNLVTSNIEYN